jgi:pentatricopeptide repeat protein
MDLNQTEKSKDIWNEMKASSVLPDYWCFSMLAEVCKRTQDIQMAKELCASLHNNEFNIQEITSFDCSNLIKTFCDGREIIEAASLLKWMGEHQVIPEEKTYILLLRSCPVLKIAKYIHAHIESSGIEQSPQLQTTLLMTYSKRGSIADARIVFDSMQFKNTVIWNFMIQGYWDRGNHLEVALLFELMEKAKVKPNYFTYKAAIAASESLSDLKLTEKIHSQLEQGGTEWNDGMKYKLMKSYLHFGKIEKARHLFDRMMNLHPVVWTTMIQGYVQNGNPREATEVFRQMLREETQPTVQTYVSTLAACAQLSDLELGMDIHDQIDQRKMEWSTQLKNSLLNMYIKCKRLDRARAIFDDMQSKDVLSWNTMISAYERGFYGEQALEMFEQMTQAGVQPNESTWEAVFSLCARFNYFSLGTKLHAQAEQLDIKWSQTMKKGLLIMYAKCGNLDKARSIFDTMTSKTVATWSTMIYCYVSNGNPTAAIEVWKRMEREGVRPDWKVYKNLVEACSQLGDLDLGMQIHSLIEQRGIKGGRDLAYQLSLMYAKCGVQYLPRGTE